MNDTSASFLNAEQAAQFLGGLNCPYRYEVGSGGIFARLPDRGG